MKVKNNKLSVKDTSIAALFTSLALVIGYIEYLIPFNFGIPGVKLGLANLIVIIAIYIISAKAALFISILRIILSSLLFGNAYSFCYSLVGGVLSLGVMLLIRKTKLFSVVGMSILGGVFHNIGQMIVAVFVVNDLKIALYMPVLLISGAITGFIIGILAVLTLNKLKNIVTDN